MKVDHCASSPCLNHATCKSLTESYQCSCRPGYEGVQCEINTDDCANNPCLNNGTCVDRENRYTCACKAGFTGLQCETNINECLSDPCKHGGQCVDKESGFDCICKPTYSGDTCSKSKIFISSNFECTAKCSWLPQVFSHMLSCRARPDTISDWRKYKTRRKCVRKDLGTQSDRNSNFQKQEHSSRCCICIIFRISFLFKPKETISNVRCWTVKPKLYFTEQLNYHFFFFDLGQNCASRTICPFHFGLPPPPQVLRTFQTCTLSQSLSGFELMTQKTREHLYHTPTW